MDIKTANDVFMTLHPQHKAIVIAILKDCRKKYIVSNINVDVPYFFWSIHRPMFDGIDPSEFLDIEDPKQFAIQAVYYISNHIINAIKEERNNEAQ